MTEAVPALTQEAETQAVARLQLTEHPRQGKG